MKRFMLFYGAHYYAAGGWDDFFDSFDTLEEAIKVGTEKQKADIHETETVKFNRTWFHVVDAETREKVHENFGS